METFFKEIQMAAVLGALNVKCIYKDNLLHFCRCIIDPRAAINETKRKQIHTERSKRRGDDWLASFSTLSIFQTAVKSGGHISMPIVFES